MRFWLDQLSTYSQQAAIVIGFAFASFCADNLGDLPWSSRPSLSATFVVSSGVAMTSAISVVCFASHLMLSAERLAMTTAVKVAVVAVRSRLPIVVCLYVTSLISLFLAAISLTFCMCGACARGWARPPSSRSHLIHRCTHHHEEGESVCVVAGWATLMLFLLGGFGNAIAISGTRALMRQAKGKRGKNFRVPAVSGLYRSPNTGLFVQHAASYDMREMRRPLCAESPTRDLQATARPAGPLSPPTVRPDYSDVDNVANTRQELERALTELHREPRRTAEREGGTPPWLRALGWGGRGRTRGKT